MADHRSVEKRVDHTALIAEMSAALTTAIVAWKEVGNSYRIAWESAYGAFNTALTKVEAARTARLQAERESLIFCAELAIAVMPAAGVALAPILSARGALLAKTIARSAKSASQEAPLIASVVTFAATKAKKPLAEVQQKVKTSILDALIPMDVAAQLGKGKTSAADAAALAQAYVDAITRVEYEMSAWVQKVSHWNAAGEIESHLTPVAHSLFMNHPWIARVPSALDSQQARPNVARAIELALWLNWLKARDMPYWYRVAEAVKRYSAAKTEDGRASVRSEFRGLLDDLIDFAPLWPQLGEVDKMFRYEATSIPESTKYSPFSSPAKIECPNMYQLIRIAKRSGTDMQANALKKTFVLNPDARDRAAVLLSAAPSELKNSK